MEVLPPSQNLLDSGSPGDDAQGDDSDDSQEFQAHNLQVRIDTAPDAKNSDAEMDSCDEADEKDDDQKENDQEEEDDNIACPICMESWTNSGSHRLVSLKCGHLFGMKCIRKWILAKKPAAKCPQCNTPASKRDIRVIFTRKLMAVDTAEHDKLVLELNDERMRCRRMTADMSLLELKLSTFYRELESARNDAMHWKRKYEQISKDGSFARADGLAEIFKAHSSLNSGPEESFRILAYCRKRNSVILGVSTAKGSATSHGFSQISVEDLNWRESIPSIHEKQIRDIAVHPHGGCVLSTSWDQKLRIVDIERTKTIVQSFNLPSPAWSCTWSIDVSSVYAGLSNGSVVSYDLRNSSSVTRIDLPAEMSMALHTMEMAVIDEKTRGLFVANFKGIFFIPHSPDGNGFSAPVTIYSSPNGSQCIYAQLFILDSRPHCLLSERTKLNIENIIIPWPDTSENLPDTPQEFRMDCGIAKTITKPSIVSTDKSTWLASYHGSRKSVVIFDINSSTPTVPVQHIQSHSSFPVLQIEPISGSDGISRGFMALEEHSLFHFAAL